MKLEAYGVSEVLIGTWFVGVVLSNVSVFLVLIDKCNFKRKSRSLVLLSSLYYLVHSLSFTIFSFTKDHAFSEVYCRDVFGALSIAGIVGCMSCVLGVSLDRFTYIVYALRYKHIITRARILVFAGLTVCISISFILTSVTGLLKFKLVRHKNTVICTVDGDSFFTIVSCYISLVGYTTAFILVPVLWFRIHFLRRNIKRMSFCRSESSESQWFAPLKHTASRLKSIERISKTKNEFGISPLEPPRAPGFKKKGSTHLSSSKSSKHTIKIFISTFVILKIQYIFLFPPMLEYLSKTDYISIVVLISCADYLFGCLLLVGTDVELKQVFFRFIRVHCIELDSRQCTVLRSRRTRNGASARRRGSRTVGFDCSEE